MQKQLVTGVICKNATITRCIHGCVNSPITTHKRSYSHYLEYKVVSYLTCKLNTMFREKGLQVYARYKWRYPVPRNRELDECKPWVVSLVDGTLRKVIANIRLDRTYNDVLKNCIIISSTTGEILCEGFNLLTRLKTRGVELTDPVLTKDEIFSITVGIDARNSTLKNMCIRRICEIVGNRNYDELNIPKSLIEYISRCYERIKLFSRE